VSEQPEPGEANVISIDDFAKIDLRVARVVEASDHPNADKLLLLTIDLGGEQRTLCAGLKGYYTPEQLVGRNIIVVANLAPRMMRGIESQGMLLAASSADRARVVLLTTESDIKPGTPVG